MLLRILHDATAAAATPTTRLQGRPPRIKCPISVILDFGCGLSACESNADCDDGDPCTFDICIIGVCLNFTIPDCK